MVNQRGGASVGCIFFYTAIVLLAICVALTSLSKRIDKLERAAEKIESSQAWEEETGR